MASDPEGTVSGVDFVPEDVEWDTIEQESGEKISFENPEDSFVGYFVESAVIEPEQGEPFEQQRFRDAQGRLYAINGGFKVKRALANVTPGTLVRLVYMGEIDTGQPSPMKDFRVDVAKSNPKGGSK